MDNGRPGGLAGRLRESAFVIVVLAAGCTLPAMISTTAGGPGRGPGTALDLGRALHLEAVPGGVLFGDTAANVVRRIDAATGQATVVAGVGSPPGYHDGDGGLAIASGLSSISAISADASGNRYVCEGSGWLRKIDSQGYIWTIAGTGSPGFSGDDGPASLAAITCTGLAVEPTGTVLTSGGGRVRRIDTQGIITTIAGTGATTDSGDGGPATAAGIGETLFMGSSIAVDGAGRIAVLGQSRVRLIDESGVINTVAGTGGSGLAGDGGPATLALLNYPAGIAFDAVGRILIADMANNRIRRVDGGIITTIAGTGPTSPNPSTTVGGYGGDGGPAIDALFSSPRAVAAAEDGTVFVADDMNARVRKIDPDGILHTIAGGGPPTEGTAATDAQISAATVAVDASGDQYVVKGTRVRRISSGVITTVADASSGLLSPRRLAGGPAGTVFVYDGDRRQVFRIDGTTVTTVAGNGGFGSGGDGGPATAAAVGGVDAMALDAAGQLFLSTALKIRKIDLNGIITTVAGTGVSGPPGDGGPALLATFGSIRGMAFDPAGNLYLSDGNRVRRIATDGIVTNFAGATAAGFAGDGGPAVTAQLSAVWGVAADAAGNVYVADSGNHRVRRVNTSGTISTIAGTGVAGLSGDGGAPTAARLDGPAGLATDTAGSLYVSDERNKRVRKIVRPNA